MCCRILQGQLCSLERYFNSSRSRNPHKIKCINWHTFAALSFFFSRDIKFMKLFNFSSCGPEQREREGGKEREERFIRLYEKHSHRRAENNHLCNCERLTVTFIRNERRNKAREGEKTCKVEQSNLKKQVKALTRKL